MCWYCYKNIWALKVNIENNPKFLKVLEARKLYLLLLKLPTGVYCASNMPACHRYWLYVPFPVRTSLQLFLSKSLWDSRFHCILWPNGTTVRFKSFFPRSNWSIQSFRIASYTKSGTGRPCSSLFLFQRVQPIDFYFGVRVDTCHRCCRNDAREHWNLLVFKAAGSTLLFVRWNGFVVIILCWRICLGISSLKRAILLPSLSFPIIQAAANCLKKVSERMPLTKMYYLFDFWFCQFT